MRASGLFTALSVVTSCLLVAAAGHAQGWPPPPTNTTPQPQPTATQPKPTTGGFDAGGLAPPPPMTDRNAPTAPRSATETRLQKSEKDDAGRGLEWFYIQAEGGLEVLGLQTMSSSGLAYGPVKTTAVGPMYGAAMGVKLMFFTFGARGRMGNFDQYKVATLNGEFGFHIPLGDLEPYFTVSGGYARLMSLNEASDWGASKVTVQGFDVRLGAGLDYYVTPVFSIGALLTGEMLGLSRGGVNLDTYNQTKKPTLSTADQTTARASGSSIGSAMTISAVLGLHF